MKAKQDNSSFVLSVSYGDYLNGVGGTDRVIKAHQEMLNEVQVSYLYIYPLHKINNKIRIAENIFWGCILDGYHIGILSTAGVQAIINTFINENKGLQAVFIHHLKNVNISELGDLLKDVTSPIYFYLHDYMTICPSGGLITSNDRYCEASFPNKRKCSECGFFGEKNSRRIDEIRSLFRKISVHLKFIAPSMAACNEWIKCYPEYENDVIVIKHQHPEGIYQGNLNEILEKAPLKIGFVGYQKSLKGWDFWIEAAKNAITAKCNYKFYQFGTTNEHYSFIEEVNVDFKKSLTSMTDALREKGVHIAVLWSIWPETYSYTYYEAWAANAFILCNELSGNICDQVHATGNGIVIHSPEQLVSFLSDEVTLRKLVNDYRRKRECGPEALPENRELVDLVMMHTKADKKIKKNHCSDASWLRKKIYNILFLVNGKIKNTIRRK